MAKRYSKLPSELMELTTFDFSFNVKVMNRSLNHEVMVAKQNRFKQKARSKFNRRR